jgi:hypothetical protein
MNNDCDEWGLMPPMEKSFTVTIIPVVSRASSPTVSGVFPPNPVTWIKPIASGGV